MEDISSLSIAELKKKIQEKENSLKSNFVNPIDKFTSIDDLLRETVIALRSSIEEQRINNKLLLAIYYKDGSITPYEPNGVDTSAILEGLRGGDDYQTLNPLFHNLKVDGKQQIINIEGSGIIDVIKFVSSTSTANNKSYSVRITCDKTVLYANTFTELEARTPNERGMVCYEDTINLEYIMMFKLIGYTKSIKIDVYNSNNVDFSLIQIKYHKKV